MENIVFYIAHHSTIQKHKDMLILCVNSIRKIYPYNKIIVCRTSTSDIPSEISTEVEFIITPLDGSHIYGAIKIICENIHENYILLHDGMILRKELPDEILTKKFYYLWHFDFCHIDQNQLTLDEINRNLIDTDILTHRYYKEFCITWYGLFGPAFGGNLSSLRIFWKSLNISDLNCIKSRGHIMSAERYFSVVATQLGIYEPFSFGPSLNGNIRLHPHWGTDDCNLLESTNYDSYMWKLWCGRS